MQSIRDYAKNKGVSYEAVRKQVNRYKVELGEHIIKHGKTQYLDDEAIAFLDERRGANPVIIVNEEKDHELEALRAENKALLVKIAELEHEQKLMERQLNEEIKVLQAEKVQLLEQKNKRKWWQWKA